MCDKILQCKHSKAELIKALAKMVESTSEFYIHNNICERMATKFVNENFVERAKPKGTRCSICGKGCGRSCWMNGKIVCPKCARSHN